MRQKRAISKLRSAVYQLTRETKSGLPSSKEFKVLGIETSCDDTAVAIVSSEGKILSNYVHSQHTIHNKYGGIVPALAMESHQRKIKIAVSEALSRAGLKDASEVDGVAVTQGPGLEICLRVGIEEAKHLARTYNKPFVTVHHHEAHCLVARRFAEVLDAETVEVGQILEFPFLTLLASGGHTSLLCCNGIGDHTLLGTTLDDAIGESFDKGARLLGINSAAASGGAAIEQFARQGDPSRYLKYLPVPMLKQKNCDFSYSGLKNAFRLLISDVRRELDLNEKFTNAPASSYQIVSPENIVKLPETQTRDLCASFQHVAFSHIEDRVLRAIGYLHDTKSPIRTMVVVGGVAANQELRRLLNVIKERANAELIERNIGGPRWEVAFPPPTLCTDNGVMVAWTGVELFQAGISNDRNADVHPIPRWPIGDPLLEKEKERFRKRSKSFLSRRFTRY